MKLKVFQIYYHESQRPKLEASYLPFFNHDATLFFESQVIADLVRSGHHNDCDYFGVVSYKLREKIGTDMKDNWRGHANIANHSINNFTPEQFEEELFKHNPDVMSFQCHQGHDPVGVAEAFHYGFRKLWFQVMKEINYDWQPTFIENIFYCNFFVAKSEIYETFVSDMLMPAMRIMEKMPELMADSGYRSTPLPEKLKLKYGIEHWPFHPFICERFFSWYAHIHKLKCLHY